MVEEQVLDQEILTVMMEQQTLAVAEAVEKILEVMVVLEDLV